MYGNRNGQNYPPQAPYNPPYETYGQEEEQPPYEGEYEGEYQQPAYEEYGQEAYEEPAYEEVPNEPEIVSTSQAINLTCTLAAVSGLFALFLYIADKRSIAVRRISVQSIALAGGYLCAAVVLWIVGTLLGLIPILGLMIVIIFWLLFFVLTMASIFFKIQMMLHAYRGEAYQLPLIGGHVRKFE